MLIIPDTWRLGVKGFKHKLPAIIERIKEILAEVGQAYIIAPNGRIAGIIRGELQKAGIDAQVDYYRSVNTIGVARPERVCIAIGTAQVPSNAYDYLAHGKDHDERLIESQRLRRQSVHCATWQAWSRVKDPEGKAESRVYCIGVPLKEVKEISLWGTGRRLELKEIKEQKTPDGSVRIPVFEVKVDKELCCARIQAANKHGNHNQKRRRVSDYIAGIRYFNKETSINEIIKIFQNVVILPNNIVRGNDYKLEIFNFPKNNIELNKTAISLYALFATRTDIFARQYWDDRFKEWRFFKVIRDWTEDFDMVKDHIEGKITIGVYNISPDDLVIWICFDVDDHEGTKDARAECEKLLAVLRSYGIPFLLEASGSPGSYHIWVLLEPTKTHNAFVFARQVASEAGFEGEVWPKQKSINEKSKGIGNLVKLPVCYHHKSGSRSVFLNPDFEPIEGPIIPPGLVRLLEIPDYSKPARERSQGEWGASWSSSKALDFCMERALVDGLQLNSSDGHNFRLAIAVKAQVIGMTAEAAAQLFQHQEDYDFEYSLNKVRETWTYNYSPWSCSVLKDKCGSIVSRYCSSCPFGGGRILQKSKEVPA
jgi:hypothetical protein